MSRLSYPEMQLKLKELRGCLSAVNKQHHDEKVRANQAEYQLRQIAADRDSWKRRAQAAEAEVAARGGVCEAI